ncbi:hypothetical protein CIB48_g8766 [Xylaria polymorpha]|nr:hypothetical protein CIB48_g8766 [Xylaria polymorpha]
MFSVVASSTQPDSLQLGNIPRIAFHAAATILASLVAVSAQGLTLRLPFYTVSNEVQELMKSRDETKHGERYSE